MKGSKGSANCFAQVRLSERRPHFCSSLGLEAPLGYLGSQGCCPSKENKINMRTVLRNKAKGCLNFRHLFPGWQWSWRQAAAHGSARSSRFCATFALWETGPATSGAHAVLQGLLGSIFPMLVRL